MPVFVGHPARGLGAEHDRRPALGLAGKDAVAAGQVLVELRLVDVARLGVEHARGGDPVDGEAAQRFAVVVPGVQVPVVAVMGDPLRRDGAPGLLVGRARAVVEGELLALEHRTGHGTEGLLVQLARAVRHHPHPFHRPAPAAGLFGQQRLDPLLERRQRAGQHAAAGARQQLLRRKQRVQLLRTQPQAGEFEAIGLLLVVAEAGLAVAHHRRHQRIAQEGQVAIDGRARTAQFLLQPRYSHRVARGLEDAVQRGDAFVAVHRCLVRRPFCVWGL